MPRIRECANKFVAQFRPVRISLFSDTQNLVDPERGHSCPPLCSGQRQSGQECPRSEKSEMRTFVLVLDSLFRLFEGEGKAIEDEDEGRRTRTMGREVGR